MRESASWVLRKDRQGVRTVRQGLHSTTPDSLETVLLPGVFQHTPPEHEQWRLRHPAEAVQGNPETPQDSLSDGWHLSGATGVKETHVSDAFLELCGLPTPERNYLFAKAIGRKWAFDLAWPDRMLAIEIEGGIWTQGRHTRGRGFEGDIAKYNQATLMGWAVLRITPGMLLDCRAMTLLKTAATTYLPA